MEVFLIGVVGLTSLILLASLFVKPRHIHIDFPFPPGFARINTPREDWDATRRTVSLSNGDRYIIPEKAKGHFVLLHDWHVECGSGKNKVTYCLPRGASTDFASIPRILHSLVSPISNSVYAAVLHDYVYRNPSDPVAKSTSKSDADRLFYWGLRACGVNRITAGLMFIGVTVGGKASYKR